MKITFLHPRFDGARFTEHTLPLDVAGDLAAYEALLVDLAKHLYLRDYKERQRVPKGFAKDFHVHIERLEEGSTLPVLSVVAAGLLALDAGTNIYFERARDLISECIALPDGLLPAEFPKELLAHFNQIGRSLRDGESMDLPRPNGHPATLTPERRKNLVLKADQVYEQEIELSGTIEEADWKNSTFRRRTLEGDRFTIPMPHSFHAKAGQLGGKDRHLVTFSGVAAFDSWDKLQKVLTATDFDVQLNYVLSTRLDEIRTLQDGWFEGAGKAMNPEQLDGVTERFVRGIQRKFLFPRSSRLPRGICCWSGIYPVTPLSTSLWRTCKPISTASVRTILIRKKPSRLTARRSGPSFLNISSRASPQVA